MTLEDSTHHNNDNDSIIFDLPVIDIEQFMNRDNNNDTDVITASCKVVADCLHKYGVLVIRDPRATSSDNDTFLNMMESYFESTDFTTDARPNLGYQVGVTPPLQEKPRNHCQRVLDIKENNRPITLCPPELDKKSRFFWRIGPRPTHTQFDELNATPVIPASHASQWESTMNMWGGKMLDAIHEVVTMVAVGLDLPPSTLLDKMKFGPHLLAPTGSDFNKYDTVDTVLAGYHYDLNLLTIHGKSRYPGLYIWLRSGQRVKVCVPDGCLLVQAGKQLEYLTGGYILAGFHEVVITSETVECIQKERANQKSLFRVSSTLFAHTASDEMLCNLLLPNATTTNTTEDNIMYYPPVLAGDQVRQELKDIQLLKS